MNIQATAKSQSARCFTCSIHQSCTHMSKLEKQVWLRTYLAYAGTGPYHDHHCTGNMQMLRDAAGADQALDVRWNN